MPRRVFFSFHYGNDFWRAQQIRNIGALEGQPVCNVNAWEEVKRKGKAAIESWIDENMTGRSCVVVLVGSETASRPWVLTEIVKGWNAGKGVLGLRINKLLNMQGKPSAAGANPFNQVRYNESGKMLSSIAPLVDPPGTDSKAAYGWITNNIEDWIEEAIRIRKVN